MLNEEMSQQKLYYKIRYEYFNRFIDEDTILIDLDFLDNIIKDFYLDEYKIAIHNVSDEMRQDFLDQYAYLLEDCDLTDVMTFCRTKEHQIDNTYYKCKLHLDGLISQEDYNQIIENSSKVVKL